MKKHLKIKELIIDVLYAIIAGVIVGTAYHFFQNSNGFAPGGVGGLATITHHLLSDYVSWSVLMIAFNVPIFILVAIFIDKKLGILLSVYMVIQSLIPYFYNALGAKPYCLVNNADDYNVVFACIATGVISGFGFLITIKRFGASGGTYAISALIKKAKPDANIAYTSFIMDASVVCIAFFVYDMKVTPVICTLLNLFIANMIVDNGISGLKNGYKFEIITDDPTKLANILIERLKRGVTQIQVKGLYTQTDKYMLVCIINKRQIGEMMKLLKEYPSVFASFEKVNEVFGNFKQKVK